MRTFNNLLLLILLSTYLYGEQKSDQYFDMSLEELMNIEVSGITRQESNSFKATSAIFVITSDEIRRFGATSIPEILQMVPGFNVGRLTSNMWAINARGGADRQSRDLLVMIDGRNVYSPTVNNVYWDHIDTLLEDIDKVEIIRGPGSSLWGSNAANGIVNIVTKNTKNTKGFLGYAQAATEHLNYDFGARFGIVEENYSAKLYAKKIQLDESEYPSDSQQSNSGRFNEGDKAHDGKTLSLIGFRTDILYNNNTNLMINAEFTSVDTQEVKISSFSEKEVEIKQDGAYIISVLDMKHSRDIKSKLQMYIDYYKRKDIDFEDKRTIYDIDFQNEIKNDNLTTLWGIGYRLVEHKTQHQGNTFAFALDPKDEDLDYLSGFLNFDYKMFNDKLLLTLGSKYEDNPYTHTEFMPNARVGFYPNDKNTIWASFSKTTSTPSRVLEDAYLDMSFITDPTTCASYGGYIDPTLGCINDLGSDNSKSSHMYVYELGYRVQLNKQLTIDQTLYHNDYKDHNDETSKLNYIRGYEVSVNYFPREDLRFYGFYSFQDSEQKKSASANLENDIPENTFGLRASYDFTLQHEFDIFYRYVSTVNDIDPINQLNIRFGYKPNKYLETSLLLSNLLDGDHVESNTDSLRANSYIQRSALIKLTFRY